MCGCYACIGDQPAYEGTWLTVGMTRMIVCAECGNKRCPHGTDHRNACTGSNDAGQDGSRYPKFTPLVPNDNRTLEERAADFLAEIEGAP